MTASEGDRPTPPPGGASWREAPGLLLRGAAMGMADVIPGVSGGTVALVVGIYGRLVDAIRSFDADAGRLLLGRRFAEARDRVAWRFLLLLLTGIATGIVFCVKVVRLPQLLETHREQVYGLFFGLIAGSVVLLGRDVLRAGFTGARLLAALGGLAAGLVIVTLSPGETPETPWFVFLCGVVAICAMILPGISGSFILLILRKYAYVMNAVDQVIHPTSGLMADRVAPLVQTVIPFGLGCVVGIAAFSRLLGWVLSRAEQATLAAMTGLLAGSLWVVWPFQRLTIEVVRDKPRVVSSTPRLPEALDGTALAAFGLMALGVVLVPLLDRVARRKLAETTGGPEGAGS